MRNALITLTFGALTCIANAQDGATTLSRLTDRADAVVRVRVLATETHDHATTRAVLQPRELLKGPAIPGNLELIEPGGRACGRAIHGLMRGAGYLAFLRRDAADRWVLLGGGARSIVRVDPTLVEYVGALCEPSNDRLATLIAGLDSPSKRVRDDAALSLATTPSLHAANPAQRARIANEVRAAMERTDRTTLSMLTVTARLRLAEVVPELTDRYIADADRSFAPALARAIRIADADVVGAISAERFATAGTVHRARILTLLETLPGTRAASGLREVMRCGDGACRVRAGTAWMRAGLDAVELREHLDPRELDVCRTSVVHAPKFRSIRPRAR